MSRIIGDDEIRENVCSTHIHDKCHRKLNLSLEHRNPLVVRFRRSVEEFVGRIFLCPSSTVVRVLRIAVVLAFEQGPRTFHRTLGYRHVRNGLVSDSRSIRNGGHTNRNKVFFIQNRNILQQLRRRETQREVRRGLARRNRRGGGIQCKQTCGRSLVIRAVFLIIGSDQAVVDFVSDLHILTRNRNVEGDFAVINQVSLRRSGRNLRHGRKREFRVDQHSVTVLRRRQSIACNGQQYGNHIVFRLIQR